jgi:hypothetical protein
MASRFFQLLDRLLTFLSVFKSQDRLVFSVMVMSAVLLTAARTVAPFEVKSDQATQLEVAQRLIQGMGITTTNAPPWVPGDVFPEPRAQYLTDWPPGFSLLVAAFLYIGMPLLVTLQIIYASTTIAGWIGWAIIASYVIARPSAYGKLFSFIHLAVCALMPILFTPWWGGTDLFLWAGVPFVFMCCFGIGGRQPSLLSIGFAGLLFGSLFAMRYTSLFVGLAATLVLIQVSYPRIKILLTRLTVFGLSALTLMLPVVLFLMHGQSSKKVSLTTPSAVGVDIPKVDDHPRNLLSAGRYIVRGLHYTSILVLGHPLLQQIIYTLKVNWLAYLTGIISLTIILSLPLLLWRSASENGLKVKDDVTLGLSFLPLSLVAFLIATAFATWPYYLEVTRYYEPVGLCGIFIFYRLANRRGIHQIVKRASQAILLMFIAYVCLYSPALAFTQRRASLVISILGFTPSTFRYQSTSQEIEYPGHRLYARKESTRENVKQLYKDHPQAIFYTENYGYFIYDGFQGGPVPGRNLRPLPTPAFWRHAYTTRPVKIFWVVDVGTPLRFLPDSNKRLIFSDPIERTEILVSDFPVGPISSMNQLAGNK